MNTGCTSQHNLFSMILCLIVKCATMDYPVQYAYMQRLVKVRLLTGNEGGPCQASPCGQCSKATASLVCHVQATPRHCIVVMYEACEHTVVLVCLPELSTVWSAPRVTAPCALPSSTSEGLSPGIMPDP